MCILVFPRKIDQMLAICNLDIVTMFIIKFSSPFRELGKNKPDS
jgi:hypothetical protein